MKTRSLLLISALVLFCSSISYAQVPAAAGETLTDKFKAQVASLTAANDWQGALALYEKMGSGKWGSGDAKAQADVLANRSVISQKGKILINLRRFADADRAYYFVFDRDLARAETKLRELAEYRKKGRLNTVETSLAKGAEAIASADLTLASTVKTLRHSAYISARVPLADRPEFDAAGTARLEALEGRLRALRAAP